MGFSLIFMRLNGDEQLDADREGLALFLQQRGLHHQPGNKWGDLVDQQGQALAFDGFSSDLHLDALDKPEPLNGGIFHATLSDAECEFIYELCIAGKFLIVNPQGDPMSVIPGNTHDPADLDDMDVPVPVSSWQEMRAALTGNFSDFVSYKERVLSDPDLS